MVELILVMADHCGHRACSKCKRIRLAVRAHVDLVAKSSPAQGWSHRLLRHLLQIIRTHDTRDFDL